MAQETVFLFSLFGMIIIDQITEPSACSSTCNSQQQRQPYSSRRSSGSPSSSSCTSSQDFPSSFAGRTEGCDRVRRRGENWKQWEADTELKKQHRWDKLTQTVSKQHSEVCLKSSLPRWRWRNPKISGKTTTVKIFVCFWRKSNSFLIMFFSPHSLKFKPLVLNPGSTLESLEDLYCCCCWTENHREHRGKTLNRLLAVS